MSDQAEGDVASTLSVFTLYRDPAAAVRWLCEALSFIVVNQFDDDGTVIHAELRRGEAVVIIQQAAPGQEPAPPIGGATVRAPYPSVACEAEIDQLHQQAVDLGASSLHPPERTRWGNYRCELLDPQGHQWSFGTYVPGHSR